MSLLNRNNNNKHLFLSLFLLAISTDTNQLSWPAVIHCGTHPRKPLRIVWERTVIGQQCVCVCDPTLSLSSLPQTVFGVLWKITNFFLFSVFWEALILCLLL